MTDIGEIYFLPPLTIWMNVRPAACTGVVSSSWDTIAAEMKLAACLPLDPPVRAPALTVSAGICGPPGIMA